MCIGAVPIREVIGAVPIREVCLGAAPIERCVSGRWLSEYWPEPNHAGRRDDPRRKVMSRSVT